MVLGSAASGSRFDGRDVIFGAVLLSLLALSAFTLRAFTSYIVAAGLFAFLLAPLHRRLAVAVGRRLSASVLVVVAATVVVVPLSLVGWVALRDAVDASDDLTGRPMLAAVDRLFTSLRVDVDVLGSVRALRSQLLSTLVGEVTELFGVAVKLTIGLSLLAFLLYYFLLDGHRLVAWIRNLGLLRREVEEPLYENARAISWAVLKGHVLVSLVQGLVGGVGLYVAGVPNAPFWTVVMVLLAFVPVVGVAAVWVPATGYLLFVGEPTAALFLLAYSATLVSWIDNVLRAIVVTRDADLHTGLVLAGVMGGVYFWGILGIFIGPIVLGLCKVALQVYAEYYLAPDVTDTAEAVRPTR